jgi:hypothetical protein
MREKTNNGAESVLTQQMKGTVDSTVCSRRPSLAKLQLLDVRVEQRHSCCCGLVHYSGIKIAAAAAAAATRCCRCLLSGIGLGAQLMDCCTHHALLLLWCYALHAIYCNSGN